MGSIKYIYTSIYLWSRSVTILIYHTDPALTLQDSSITGTLSPNYTKSALQQPVQRANAAISCLWGERGGDYVQKWLWQKDRRTKSSTTVLFYSWQYSASLSCQCNLDCFCSLRFSEGIGKVFKTTSLWCHKGQQDGDRVSDNTLSRALLPFPVRTLHFHLSLLSRPFPQRVKAAPKQEGKTVFKGGCKHRAKTCCFP